MIEAYDLRRAAKRREQALRVDVVPPSPRGPGGPQRRERSILAALLTTIGLGEVGERLMTSCRLEQRIDERRPRRAPGERLRKLAESLHVERAQQSLRVALADGARLFGMPPSREHGDGRMHVTRGRGRREHALGQRRTLLAARPLDRDLAELAERVDERQSIDTVAEEAAAPELGDARGPFRPGRVGQRRHERSRARVEHQRDAHETSAMARGQLRHERRHQPSVEPRQTVGRVDDDRARPRPPRRARGVEQHRAPTRRRGFWRRRPPQQVAKPQRRRARELARRPREASTVGRREREHERRRGRQIDR